MPEECTLFIIEGKKNMISENRASHNQLFTAIAVEVASLVIFNG